MTDRSKRLRAVGVVVSVVSLVGVVLWASTQEAPRLPRDSGEWLALAGGVLAYASAVALRSERWRALLRHDGAEPSRADCYGLTVVGFMGNNVLPARGGDVLRVYYMSRRDRIAAREVIGSLVAERVLDVAVLVTAYLVVGYGLLSGIALPGGSRFVLAAAALAALAAALAIAWVLLRRSGKLDSVKGFIRPMLTSTRGLKGAHGASMVALTVAIWSIEAVDLMLIGASVGLDVTVLEAFYLIGLGGVFLLIPSGPGYAGTFDAAMLFGAGAIGASGSLAFSFLLAARFVIFVPVTVLGLILVLVRYGWGEPAGEAPASARP